MQRLTGYGLRLASQLPVPGAVARDDTAPPDVTITLEPAQPMEPAPLYCLTDTGLTFACPQVATYRITSGSIAVVPDPTAASGMVSAMLVATALPALLWLRGRFVLHAAAVQFPDGGALAIAGETGSGKSTIVAQLVAGGAALIGDDTIAFDPTAGTLASGLAGGWFASTADGGRNFVPASPDRSCSAAAIGAILILERDATGAGKATRLTPVAAVARLLANRHRPRVPTLLGMSGKTLHHTTLLATAIPLYSWRRRTGAVTLTPDEWGMLKRFGIGREQE